MKLTPEQEEEKKERDRHLYQNAVAGALHRSRQERLAQIKRDEADCNRDIPYWVWRDR